MNPCFQEKINMKYIDIHCHLDASDYDDDRKDVLARMKEKEVGAITIGTDLASSKRAVRIAEENENIWACIGIHPDEAGVPLSVPSPEQGEGYAKRGVGFEFEELVQSPKVVGIGECGLDYFRIKEESQKDLQKQLFEDQIQFALKHSKSLMLHCRGAYDDTLDILENYKKEAGDKLRGNVHFFAGNTAQAKRFLDISFTCSFTGVITFTHDYDEVIRYLPQDSIMSETDAPYVAPVPHRGKRNEPVFVIEVLKQMALIRGSELEILQKAVINNSKRIFNVGDIIKI